MIINMNNLEDEFYTIDETARILKLSNQTIRKMLKENKIAYIKIGRNYRISKNELNLTLKENCKPNDLR